MSRFIEATKSEIIQEVKKPGPIYVYTRLTRDNVCGIKAVKKSLLLAIEQCTKNETFEYFRTEDNLFLGY